MKNFRASCMEAYLALGLEALLMDHIHHSQPYQPYGSTCSETSLCSSRGQCSDGVGSTSPCKAEFAALLMARPKDGLGISCQFWENKPCPLSISRNYFQRLFHGDFSSHKGIVLRSDQKSPNMVYWSTEMSHTGEKQRYQTA